jgi:hypothetical protein
MNRKTEPASADGPAVLSGWNLQVRILAGVNCALLFLLVLGFFVFPKNRGIPPVVSTLLPERDIPRISSIIISAPGNGSLPVAGTVTLEKQGNGWTGESSAEPGARFPVAESMISGFIETLGSRRNLYPLSSSASAWSSLGLTTQEAFHVQLRGSGGEIISDIFWGSDDFSGKRIALRTGRDITSFSTENDIYPYLKTQGRFWAVMELVPDRFSQDRVQEVSLRSLSGAQSPSGALSLSLRRYSGGWNSDIEGGTVSGDIDAWLETLSSARGSGIVRGLPLPPEAAADLITVRLGLGDNTERLLTFAVFPQENLPGEGENQYSVYYGTGSGYGLTVSEWTWNRILPDFLLSGGVEQ